MHFRVQKMGKLQIRLLHTPTNRRIYIKAVVTSPLNPTLRPTQKKSNFPPRFPSLLTPGGQPPRPLVTVCEVRRDPFVILPETVMLKRQLTRNKLLNAVGSDENIAASSELNSPVYNTVRFTIHKTIIP